MISALASLKSLIRTKSYHIDYPLFRLHYQATTCALLAFCLILTAKILFGDTIDCKNRGMKRDDFYDNMCFSQGTYTQYAIDESAIRDAIQQQNTSGPITEPAQQLLKILHTMENNRVTSVRDSSNLPAITDPPTTESWYQKAAGYLLEVAGDTYSQRDQQVTTIVSSSVDTKFNVTNHTFVKGNYFNLALAGTEVGDFIKDQYRVIHRIIKNNNLPYSSQIRYLYSGVMIPRDVKEMYTYTFWHRYYQYIPIILFLQAVFFYIPHYLWKNWENGIVSSICKGLYDNKLAPTEYIETNYHVIDYLQNCFTLNKSLVYKYYFCHLLLLANLIGQIVVLNAIFNEQFVTYGIDVFYHMFIDKDIYGLRGEDDNFSDLNNPMDFVFPKITACTFRTLSQAGMTTDESQFLCILPLNILHDKFFLILWFWFLILAMLTTFQIMFDITYVIIPKMRKFLFRRRFGPYLSEDNRHSSSLPELFILDLIGTNSDKFAFSALLRKLNKADANGTDNGSWV